MMLFASLQFVSFLTVVLTFKEEMVDCFINLLITVVAKWVWSAVYTIQVLVETNVTCSKL